MAELPRYTKIELLAAGTIATVDLSLAEEQFIVTTTGNVTLVGNCTISPTGTAYEGMTIKLKYNGRITTNMNNVDVFGTYLTQEQLMNNCIIECIYIDSAWKVTVLVDDAVYPRPTSSEQEITIGSTGGTTLIHPSRNSEQIFLTGTATLTSDFKISDMGAAGGAIKNGASFYIHYRANVTLNGNDVEILGYKLTEYQALNGGLLIIAKYTNTEALPTYDLTVIEDKKISGTSELIVEKFLVTPTQMGELNSNSPLLKAAQGTGKIIEIIGMSITNDFGSIPYVTSVGTVYPVLRYVGGGVICTFTNTVFTTTSRYTERGIPTVASSELYENKGIELYCSEDPTYGWSYAYGDSPIYVTLVYFINDVS